MRALPIPGLLRSLFVECAGSKVLEAVVTDCQYDGSTYEVFSGRR